jgi:hypothetical protein
MPVALRQLPQTTRAILPETLRPVLAQTRAAVGLQQDPDHPICLTLVVE